MNTSVLSAVFKRNFISYFSNPTGYVFICVFVFLSAVAAFCPNEFFNANLANLDQLNLTFPFIMLIFIPAITMSIWADESRQGTDELLLTIPASDFDIVLGKYFAASAIYTVSLAFSLISNYIVLRFMGSPDGGLFLATYFGYWLLGLAMLAVGMIASFLTRNLTVAYILGALFNAPLVFMSVADAVPTVNRKLALTIKDWSFGGRFDTFGRGLLTLSGLAYFLLVVAVMLYLSIVLIGRRHWVRGDNWGSQAMHFLVRTVSLVVVAVGLVYVLGQHDVRLDATSEQLSSLSPHTVKLIGDLHTAYEKAENKRPVRIEAFISPEVPESYIQTRLNLLTTLRELKARAGSMMEVQVNETEQFGPVADIAKKRYNIAPKRVTSMVRGAYSQQSIFLGVAFTCGQEKVVLPFIDRGIPVEYELVRSLCTVTQQKRKRIGIVETDAPLMGKFSMQGPSPSWQIINELQKQYEVVQVSPSQPIPARKMATKPGEKDEGFDVLLAVQPSAMGPQETDNLIAAVRSGQPTVIFEDPFTFFAPEVPGTSQPRRPPDQMMAMFNRQQMPKGNLKPLWKLLGVSFSGDEAREEFQPFAGDEEGLGGATKIVWQNYNPYPKLSDIPPEFVFIDSGCGNKEPFYEDDPISSKLQHLFLPAPGFIEKRNTSELKDRTMAALVKTGSRSGTIQLNEMILRTPLGSMLNPYRRQVPGGDVEYVVAAHIMGRLPVAKPAEDKPKDEKAKAEKKDEKSADANVNVVLVADVDMLTDEFFRWREQGEVPGLGLRFDFDNVTLVLNALDSLAGDERFLELRKRRPRHRTLVRFEERTEEARKETSKARDKCRRECDEAVRSEQKKLDEKVKALDAELKKSAKIDEADIERRKEIYQKDGQRRLDQQKEELEQKRNQDIESIDAKMNAEIRQEQDRYKMWAVILPPAFPLIVGALVFFNRRAREREGVSRNRLK